MKIEKSRFNSEAAPQSYVSQKKIPQAVKGDISVIRFGGIKVRIVNMGGDPWFIAKDVCAALEIVDHKVPMRRLNDNEKEGYSIPTLGGIQTMTIVSESGFYKLIARSRKASIPGTAANRFSEWVFGEVIPSIRKTGSYGVPFAFLNDHSKRKAAYDKKASKRGKDLQACKGEKSRLIAEEVELWRKYQPQLPEVH
ncbi:antirepressor protein [Klebsiella variicola]